MCDVTSVRTRLLARRARHASALPAGGRRADTVRSSSGTTVAGLSAIGAAERLVGLGFVAAKHTIEQRGEDTNRGTCRPRGKQMRDGPCARRSGRAAGMIRAGVATARTSVWVDAPSMDSYNPRARTRSRRHYSVRARTQHGRRGSAVRTGGALGGGLKSRPARTASEAVADADLSLPT